MTPPGRRLTSGSASVLLRWRPFIERARPSALSGLFDGILLLLLVLLISAGSGSGVLS